MEKILGKYEKLFHKDFLLIVIGQIISLFGNSILRFVLPLFLLDLTGSQVVFGSVLAISAFPAILLSPIGGIICDRISKRNIMVVLDFITAFIIGVFTFILGSFQYIWIIGLVLILLSIVQGLYQPAVQSSVPIISSKDRLLQSNAVVNLVSSLANLLGPIIGGLLYGYWGLIPIAVISTACFFISAVMELFIHIPFVKQKVRGNIYKMIKLDLKESIQFSVKEKPIIISVTLIIAMFNMILSSMLLVGMPILVKITLNLDSSLYGLAQGIMGFGGLIGGIIVGILKKFLIVNHYYILLILASVTTLPMGLVLLNPLPVMTSYFVLTLFCFIFTGISTIFSISMIVLIQKETRDNLLGKIMSFVMAGTMCAQPLGQALYGYIYKYMENRLYLIFFGTCAVGMVLAICLKNAINRAFHNHY